MFYGYQGLDFLGEKKPKPPGPELPPPLPTPFSVNRTTFPKWLPYAVGIAGMGIVIMLLVTTKGK